MHPVHNCHRIKLCPPSVKQYITMHHNTEFIYFTYLVELFCHRRRVGIQSDVSPWPSCLHLSSGFPFHCTVSVHDFPAVSWPSPRSSSFWLDHECFTLGSRWCHPFDVWPPPDRVLVGCLLCWLHVYSPPNFFVSDLVHSSVSCMFSETPHLCYCQHLPFFAGEGPVFTLVK